MKIACLQFAPHYRDIERNLTTLDQLLKTVDADIAVIPELALTGYFFRTTAEIETLAESTTGPTAAKMSALAKAHHTALVSGFLERAPDGAFYNAALAWDHRGALVGHYRKIHRFYLETQIFQRGNLGFPVVDIETKSGPIRTGLMICYDWRFPEAARSLALAGAELIAMPSNIVSTTGMLQTTLRTRAFENKVALAFADRTGTEERHGEALRFQGSSAIINYNGDILAAASVADIEAITCEVDLTKTHTKQINTYNDLFGDRAPQYYR